VLATMIGNFQDGSIAGKVQFGSGWWFLDQKEAMTWQMNSLSNCGLDLALPGNADGLPPRSCRTRAHEYFRRVLCDLVGKDVETGELPDDDALVGGMVREYLLQQCEAVPGPERHLGSDGQPNSGPAIP